MVIRLCVTRTEREQGAPTDRIAMTHITRDRVNTNWHLLMKLSIKRFVQLMHQSNKPLPLKNHPRKIKNGRLILLRECELSFVYLRRGSVTPSGSSIPWPSCVKLRVILRFPLWGIRYHHPETYFDLWSALSRKRGT